MSFYNRWDPTNYDLVIGVSARATLTYPNPAANAAAQTFYLGLAKPTWLTAAYPGATVTQTFVSGANMPPKPPPSSSMG